jgi:uncharacterized protein with PQ loop repeat
MSKDLTQSVTAILLGLVAWLIGFLINRKGDRSVKYVRSPLFIARLLGSKSTIGLVNAVVLPIQVWGLLCILLALVVDALSIDFNVKAIVIPIFVFGGGLISMFIGRLALQNGKRE